MNRVTQNFCLIFQILGAIVFGIGIYLKVARAEFIDILESVEFETATAFMIMCGIIVFVIAVVGFAGIWLRNQCIIGMVSCDIYLFHIVQFHQWCLSR